MGPLCSLNRSFQGLDTDDEQSVVIPFDIPEEASVEVPVDTPVGALVDLSSEVPEGTLVDLQVAEETIAPANEETLPFVPLSPETEADSASKHFDIVLVRIQAEEWGVIECVKKNLYDPSLRFLTISYRWGYDLPETTVSAPGYTARVFSFDLEDFSILCNAISNEPALKEIPYLWIDTISIDQQDETRRKDTIYHMDEIYQRSEYIVALPDLNYGAFRDKPSYKHATDLINKYNVYIYYAFNGNEAVVDELDIEWMDKVGIPKDEEEFRQSLLVLDIDSDDANVNKDDILFYLEDGNGGTKQDAQHSLTALLTSLKTMNEDLDHPQECTPWLERIWEEYISSSDDLTRNDSNETNDNLVDDALKTQWQFHLARELRKVEWLRKYHQRQRDIKLAMDYMVEIVDDYARRVWIVSEYSIAKSKRMLKLWFRSLVRTQPRLMDAPFFELFNDIGDDEMSDSELSVRRPALLSYRKKIQERLVSREFLDLLLHSSATKNADRFYAVMPFSTKYKHHIKDRNTISGYGISDMLSVRLQLYRSILDIQDKARLLFACSSNEGKVVLPTFAAVYTASRLKTDERLLGYTDFNMSVIKHYEFTADNANLAEGEEDPITLIDTWDPNKHSHQKQAPRMLPVLRLRVKQYYVRRPYSFEKYRHKIGDICQELGIKGDDLVEVSIPLFLLPRHEAETHSEDFNDFNLVGHFGNDKEPPFWVLCSNAGFREDADHPFTPVFEDWKKHYDGVFYIS